jgi:hypothetical protein
LLRFIEATSANNLSANNGGSPINSCATMINSGITIGICPDTLDGSAPRGSMGLSIKLLDLSKLDVRHLVHEYLLLFPIDFQNHISVSLSCPIQKSWSLSPNQLPEQLNLNKYQQVRAQKFWPYVVT